MPDFSTLSRRQKTLKVNIPYRGSAGPLHLLIDSTGIKVEGEGEWSEVDQKRVRGTVFWPGSYFDAAPAVIAAPSSPDRPAEAFCCAQGFVARSPPPCRAFTAWRSFGAE